MKKYLSILNFRQKKIPAAVYSVGANFALQGFALLGFLLLVRMLPLAQMGNWAIWLTVVAIADMTRQGLVQNGLVRLICAEKEAYPHWNTAALVLNTAAGIMLGGLLALTIMLYASFAGQSSFLPLTLWVFPFFLAQGLGRFAETVQISRQDFKGIFWANLLNGSVQLALIGAFFLFDKTPSLEQLVGSQMAGATAGLAFSIIFRKRYFRFGQLQKHRLYALFQFGKYAAGTNFFSLLFQRLDTLLISIFLTPALVAIYNVATRLNGLLDLPLNGLSQALYPQMAEKIAAKSSPQEVYGGGVSHLLKVQMPLSLLVVLFAPQLVQILAGEAYSSAVPLIRILAIAGLVKPWGRTFGLFLDAIGNAAFNLKMLLISFVTNLLLGLIFLPLFGLLGAAVATGTGVVVTTAIGQYFLQKQMAIRPWLVKFG